MPCNGTKYFEPPKFANDDYKLVHEVSMEKHLGSANYRELIHELILSQVHISSYGIPLTGHFINCRGSMVNWCPIGRNANTNERALFKSMDKEEQIRKRVIDELNAMLKQKKLLSKIKIKFGGDTSFDIYPKGWDKTYGLRHFNNWDIWFVGDRCQASGNDFEIYDACLPQAYKTKSPENTVEIIENIIKEIRNKDAK